MKLVKTQLTVMEAYGDKYVTLNNMYILLDSYAKVDISKNKKVRKRLLKYLRNKYRRVFKPLPQLAGDYDGDCLSIEELVTEQDLEVFDNILKLDKQIPNIFEGIDMTPIPFSELKKGIKNISISIPKPDCSGNIVPNLKDIK